MSWGWLFFIFSEFSPSFVLNLPLHFESIDVNFSDHVCTSLCFVYLIKGFFFCFRSIENLRLKRLPKFFEHSVIYIVVTLLVNTAKLQKFYRFESVQNVVSFFDLKFILFRVFLIFFSAEANIILNLFLNLEDKWASCSYKNALMKKKSVR